MQDTSTDGVRTVNQTFHAVDIELPYEQATARHTILQSQMDTLTKRLDHANTPGDDTYPTLELADHLIVGRLLYTLDSALADAEREGADTVSFTYLYTPGDEDVFIPELEDLTCDLQAVVPDPFEFPDRLMTAGDLDVQLAVERLAYAASN